MNCYNPQMEKYKADPLSGAVHRLDCCSGETVISTATCFAVHASGRTFLITNWHVVSGMNPRTGAYMDSQARVPDLIRVHLHTKMNGAWLYGDVRLRKGDSKNWREHPRGSKVDVVALPVHNDDAHLFNAIDLKLADTDMLTFPAMPVQIIGFPLGHSAFGNLPIWKTGHIASDPHLDVGESPVFLIDATTKSGMSGAPVVARQSGFVRSDGSVVLDAGFSTKLLGIYSGRINDKSDVGMVWRPNTIDEIIAAVPPETPALAPSVASKQTSPP